MAKVTSLICDKDQKPEAETIRLLVGDKSATIDLCMDCRTELAVATDPFFGVAADLRTSNGSGGPSTGAMRYWLQQADHPVPDKGKIATEYVKIYEEAHKPKDDEPILKAVKDK